MIVCSFPGCTRPHRSNGLCDGHYRQVYRGLPLKPLRHQHTRATELEDAAERFAKATTAAELAAARTVLRRAARAFTLRSLLAETLSDSRRATEAMTSEEVSA